MLDALIAILIFPVKFVSMPNSQYYWATYPAAALTGLFLLTLIRGRRLKWTVAKNLLWPIRLVRHASTGLDIKLFFVGCYYILAQALLVGGFTFLTVEASVRGLSAMFGAAPAPIAPSYAVTGATMLLVFLAVEFGYWLSHWLMHTIPALWEFHKVHHSAEVLTPLTEWRQHPGAVSVPDRTGLKSGSGAGDLVFRRVCPNCDPHFGEPDFDGFLVHKRPSAPYRAADIRYGSFGKAHSDARSSSGPPLDRSKTFQQESRLLPLNLGLGVWNALSAGQGRKTELWAGAQGHCARNRAWKPVRALWPGRRNFGAGGKGPDKQIRRARNPGAIGQRDRLGSGASRHVR
jgi:Fatty acid hydroxylase superfamily